MQKSLLVTLTLTFSLMASPLSQLRAASYLDPKAPLEDRVNDLFSKLTPKEKLSLLAGTGFTTQPIKRLKVPAMSMVDAGQGVRGGMESTQGPATAFPSGVAMGATWDPELVGRIARAIGEEARSKGTGSEVLLGPAVNIHRSPLGGRNGEYFSEDPYLAARLAVGYIQGMQSSGTLACIKHFACNNEEADRDYVDVRVGERALREIYLPAFEAGVKEGKVRALMSSYNQVNGAHASANEYLLTDVLKKGWGYDGLVMSDWGGVHEITVSQAGNDLEMPGGKETLASVARLESALKDGTFTQAAADDSAKRVLRAVIRSGLLDGPIKKNPEVVNSREHELIAREAAEKGIVLLKNDGNLLPLDASTIHSIAVIGDPAKDLQIGALGSPEVKPFYKVQILDAIQALVGPKVKVTFAPSDLDGTPMQGASVTVPGTGQPGFQAEYFPNVKLEGKPILSRVEKNVQLETEKSPGGKVEATNYGVRWTASLKAPETGTYKFTMIGDDGFRLFIDGQKIVDRWTQGGAIPLDGHIDLQAGQTYQIVAELFQLGGSAVAKLNWRLPSQTPFKEAIAAAKASDVALISVSTRHTEGEGNDRSSMDLPGNQDALVQAVAAANPKTIVVLNNGTPVTMKRWIHSVPAVLETWFPGEEGGTALAEVLFGKVNPSGKLPDTFAVDRSDYPDAANFPGQKTADAKDFPNPNDPTKTIKVNFAKVDYAEGIYVGYRHFDKANIAPLFPFGHGLSYTTFGYANLKLSQPGLTPDGKVQVSVDVTNTGQRAGEEVVQLYVHDQKPQIDKPIRELKGFSRVALQPGETKTVNFTLTPRDLAYFDVPGKQWKADAGTYDIEIGASSRDIRQKTPLSLGAVFTESVPLSQDHTQG